MKVIYKEGVACDKHTSLQWPKKVYIIHSNLFFGVISYSLYTTSSIYISNIQVWEGTQAYNAPQKSFMSLVPGIPRSPSPVSGPWSTPKNNNEHSCQDIVKSKTI